MSTRTLPRRRLTLAGVGWSHPYASPFVLYADGGDPVTPPATPPAAPPVPQPSVTPPAAPATPQDPAADIARLTKELEAARKEAGAARVNAKATAAAEARAELLKQLSGDAETPLTPEQLQAQLAEARTQGTTAQQQAASTARELAVLRAAVKGGANTEALLDSRSFMDGVAALDTADPAALAAAVTEKVTAALTANPALRAMTAGRSGGDFGGGSGGAPLDIDAQIEAATKKRDFGLVIALKRQRAATT